MARVWILMGGVVLAAVLFNVSVIRIEPHEVGVRTNEVRLWEGQGIVQRDHGAGWHLDLPFLMAWDLFPRTVRRVEFTRDPRQRTTLGGEALVVQSRDGDRVTVDIDVFYRIRPGEAHLLRADSGPGDDHSGVLHNELTYVLRSALNKLRTEEFYDPEVRDPKLAEAQETLNEALASLHLEVVALALQGIEFSADYEEQIDQKKLTDQQVEVNRAERRANAMRLKVQQIREETEQEVRAIQTDADENRQQLLAAARRYDAETRAKARARRAELQAKGELAVAQADAQVTRAKTAAMTGSGGANLAAMEAVQNLEIDSISFPTGTGDWFDVGEMAGRLGARP